MRVFAIALVCSRK